MGLEVGLPGDEPLEGVNVVARAVDLRGGLEPHPVEIVRIAGEFAVDDADRVDRILGLEKAADKKVVPAREDLRGWAELPAAEVFLEQMDDAVDHALVAPAGHVEVPRRGGDDEAVVAEGRQR